MDDVAGLRIAEIMTPVPEVVAMDASMVDVVAQMCTQGFSCLLVMDNQVLKGIITERDIVALVARYFSGDQSLHGLLARDVMTSGLVTIHPEADMFDALVLTLTRHIRHLPVVSAGGELVGIVTYRDMARSYRAMVDAQRLLMEQSVEARTRPLREMNARLRAISLEDPLMGIGNRRAMEVDLRYTHAEMRRYHHCYSIILLDLDHFKSFNDGYGHQAGDALLKRVARVFQRSLRAPDRLYRYGGEELLVLLPQESPQGALAVAHRIVRLLHNERVEHKFCPAGLLTVSAGVAGFAGEEAGDWQDLLERADQALYRAKAEGRNQARLQGLSEMGEV